MYGCKYLFSGSKPKVKDEDNQPYHAHNNSMYTLYKSCNLSATRMWANAQPDGRPAEHRWRPLFNAAKFG